MRNQPKVRTHDPEATREALLSAGTDLFAEYGFDAVRVEQIAEASGVNKALINYHFGGKAGLYSAILKATFGGMTQGVGAIVGGDLSAEDKLRGLIRAIGRMVEQRPNLPRMVLREILSGGRQIDAETLPNFLAVFGAVRAIVEEGVRRGEFREVDALSTHLGLVGSLMFFFSTERFRREKLTGRDIPLPPDFKQPDAADYLKHIEELMVRGLAADKPRRRARR
jgi:AcrR family transcriptional regulator